MDAIRGREAFNVADYDTSGRRVHLQINEIQRLLLIICAVRVWALPQDSHHFRCVLLHREYAE